MIVRLLLILLACSCGGVAIGPDAAPTDADISDLNRLLMVDDAGVKATNVRRVLGTVTKAGSVSAGQGASVTVVHDGVFKMWNQPASSQQIARLESVDGLTFTKVAEVALDGQPMTNNGASFSVDEHDPKHRFKAAYAHASVRAAIAYSADGTIFTSYNRGQPVTERAADTNNQIIWDPGVSCHRLYTRTDYGDAGGDREIRGNRGMLNCDLKGKPTDWVTTRSWMFDREPEEWRRRQIYALTDWLYEGLHFALMTVFEWPDDLSEGPFDPGVRHERNTLNFYLGTSRDGDSWDLSWVYAGQPLVPRGEAGEFDDDSIRAGTTVATHADRHWFYYVGFNERHGKNAQRAVGVATLPMDRFVGLYSDDGIVTMDFVLRSERLGLNVDTSVGTIEVGLIGDAGLIDIATVQGVDGLRVSPPWKVDLRALLGTRVQLRVALRGATLFAIYYGGE